ncbi:hypothetical protein AZI86_13245 [Bdellovibrio bacteriovorus]|uniref:N-acetyltransferase domain-containing protein n=2 Tax=Bdellovibrio bacteriovorus TaxID=959 RepID=A0A150WJI1_BDEBC|nr:hypothetical protein AZI86_13245 [Bdellovibrio bacteriovorus]
MTLYYHYKNKPYKFLGIAKHSETLEDLVVYETRYPNELATLWVRPREIFESEIEFEGKMTPRFRKARIQITPTSFIDTQAKETIAKLCRKIFGDFDPVRFDEKMKSAKAELLVATVDGKLAGFKLGYELSGEIFYSWLGGVLPEYRGVGIASELIKTQHQWCLKQGYQILQTKTQNHFREMFILNLKHGFEVIGTENSSTKGLKIILQKRLS